MLKSFLERLKGDTPTIAPLDETDTRTAVAALLVHAARIDHDYSTEEAGLIDAILAQRYELAADDAAKLRVEGEAADDASVDTFRFTQLVKTGLPESERITLLEALWSVVLSDEDRDENEDALVRKLVELMGLTPHDSAHARQRIEAAMKG